MVGEVRIFSLVLEACARHAHISPIVVGSVRLCCAGKSTSYTKIHANESLKAFIGNIPAHLVSCRKLDFFEPAGCQSREDQIGQLTSLYYSFAADVATDLAGKLKNDTVLRPRPNYWLVMFLPLIVVRKLQVNRAKKIGIMFLFSIGWICIGIAIIRVIKLGEGQGQFIPGWLAMWGSIEGAVAVMVGCGPGLYISAKEAYRSRTAASYGSGLSHGDGRVYSGVKWSGKSWTRVGDPVRNERGAIEVESRFELRETRRTPSEGDEQLLRQTAWPKEALSEIRNVSQASEHSESQDNVRHLRS